MGRNQHVVPTGDKWGIKGEGNSKYTQIFDRQCSGIIASCKFECTLREIFVFTVLYLVSINGGCFFPGGFKISVARSQS